MQISRATAGGAHLFISSKTCTAIPARNHLVRDALVQATLDPAVRSIAYIPSARVAKAAVKLAAIAITRDDGRYSLDVIEARPLRDVEEEGLALIALRDLGLSPLTLSACDIRREPKFANARFVWTYRMAAVGISLRMRILGVLSDDGPMTLSRLLSSIHSDRDPGPAVLALACSDLLELDLVSQPLGPSTIARSRS